MSSAPLLFFDRIRIAANPVANDGNVVTCGQARFTILTERLIRLEWAADAQFEDRSTFAFPTRFGEKQPFTADVAGDNLTITTQYLSLRYTADGQPFDTDNLSIRFTHGELSKTWQPGMVNYGNLRGTRRTLDQCAGEASMPEGLLSREGWTLFDDSGSVIWDTEQTWVEARPEAHQQDWYFFAYGDDYRAQLKDYIQFGGPIPLVPRYVLGAWWSRFWAYHADDLKALVNDFASHDVPLDVLVVDMDWHTPDGWTGYTWNRELFPDPEAFIAWVHAQKLYTTFNLHPAEGVQKHEAAYPDFARVLGRDPESGEGIAFDATDKAFIRNYFELLHHPMEEQGVDFWWIDWQQGSDTRIRNLDPLPWLNHLHFHDAERRGVRPMLYSRWGGLGNHRYPIGFSGDAYTTWESLAFQPYFTATAANVCYGWWSHDIGGHFGAADPELYARWVQFGALSPCLRLHSTKDPLAERRPWGFTKPVYEAARDAIQLRYQLMPYLYSASRSASQIGLSLCYPMYYDYPHDEAAYLARGQYFLGDQLIAAPIVSPADSQTSLATFDVWIPDGVWYDFASGESFTGPRWIRQYGDLNRMPLFARAGAIVPQATRLMRTQDFDGSHIVLKVFPGTSGSFELYEDDSADATYRDGSYEVTPIRLNTDDKVINLSIAAAEGHCPILPQQRSFEIRLISSQQPAQITINHQEHTDWAYDAEKNELVIYVRDISRKSAIELAVHTQQSWLTPTLVESVSAPFIHCLEYTTYEDARLQLGTLIAVAPADHVSFDLELEWKLTKNGETTIVPVILKNCHADQIIHCPFHDEGDFRAYRWSVKARLIWNGQSLDYHYQSREAYPAITNWRALFYDPAAQPVSIADVMSADGELNPQLAWEDVSQQKSESLVQPFGLVLLEHERQRLLAKESLAACAVATIPSAIAQDVTLHVQHVGPATCFLNGIELTPATPVQHPALDPMFYSWMTPQQVDYTVHLEPGDNHLVIFTQQDEAINWWGVGVTVYDVAGKILI